MPRAKLSPAAANLAVLETVEKNHGRHETRRDDHSVERDWFADRKDWEGLRSAGLVEAIREVGSQRTVERRYYLSSLPLDVATFARAVREHWGIENKVHWVLDVQMQEDQSRVRACHEAENLATLRRLALNLLNRDRTKRRGIRGKQPNAGWDHAYLLRLLRAKVWMRSPCGSHPVWRGFRWRPSGRLATREVRGWRSGCGFGPAWLSNSMPGSLG